MDHSQQQNWQAILDKTRLMHDLVNQEQWQQLVEVESERQQMITSFFAGDVSEEDSALIAEGIRQIMQSDHSLANMAAELKAEAISQLTGINNVRKAVRAYENCQKP